MPINGTSDGGVMPGDESSGLSRDALLAIIVACVILVLFGCCTICIIFCCRKKPRPIRNITNRNKGKANQYVNADYLGNSIPIESKGDKKKKDNNSQADSVMDILATHIKQGVMEAMEEQIKSMSLDQKRLTQQEVIGKGAFGVVYKGVLLDKKLQNPKAVAIKTVHGDSVSVDEIKDFVQEAIRMQSFNHPHVLSMYGLVFDDNQPKVVLPYMGKGNLRDVITDPKNELVIRDLIGYATQVAEGMVYLTQHRFVHRDLATRNCMVDESNVVKIADFGLSRDLFEGNYYSLEGGKMPIRWMAPECFTPPRQFTHESDVWSFGILMWELLTRGKRPYSEFGNEEVISMVKQGFFLEKPQYCPNEIYAIMRNCWKKNPSDRPMFTVLASLLEALVKSKKSKKKAMSEYANLTILDEKPNKK